MFFPRGCFTALAFVLVSLLAAGAAAQTPPDVVVLRDGTVFRGTLVERGSVRVVLMLATGEVREFAGADVESAGPDPAVAVPVAAPTAVVPAPPSVRLHVRGTEPGRTLHRLTESTEIPLPGRASRPQLDSMMPICAAPCDVDLPAGTYAFGVSEGSGSAHRAGAPVHLEAGELWVEIEHTDRTGIRVAGWAILGLGAAGGGLIAGFGAASKPPDVGLGGGGAWLGWDGGTWLGIGLATAGVFALIGALIGITDDHAAISIESSPPPVVEEPEEEAPRPRRRRQADPDAY